MDPAIKEAVIKISALAGVDITNESKISLMWRDGFPKDDEEFATMIQSRLGGGQSISRKNAIIKLDNVTSRVAAQRVREIEEESGEYDTSKEDNSTDIKIDDVDGVDGGVKKDNEYAHEIGLTAGDKLEEGQNKGTYPEPLWEFELPFGVRDVIMKSLDNSEVTDQIMEELERRARRGWRE